MKRKIKFRAWNGKKMSAAETIADLMASEYYPTEWIYKLVFLQFTGLKDKNGKEIYEGDVYRIVDGSTHEVKIPHIYQWMNWVQLNAEVIGNIYENPELL